MHVKEDFLKIVMVNNNGKDVERLIKKNWASQMIIIFIIS